LAGLLVARRLERPARVADDPDHAEQQEQSDDGLQTPSAEKGGQSQPGQQADRRRQVLGHASAAPVGVLLQHRRDEGQQERGRQQDQQGTPARPPQDADAEQAQEERQETAAVPAPDGIGEQAAGVCRRQPAQQGDRLAGGEGRVPVAGRRGDHRRVLLPADEEEQGGEAADQHEVVGEKEQPGGLPGVSLHEGKQGEADGPGREGCRVGGRQRDRREEDQQDQGRETVRPAKPEAGEGQQQGRGEQVEGVGLDLAGVADGVIRDGEDACREQGGTPRQGNPGEDGEQYKAGDPGEQGRQAQDDLGGAEEMKDGRLGSQEQDGRHLVEAEGAGQPEEVVLEQVEADERLVAPDREGEQPAGDALGHAEDEQQEQAAPQGEPG
jgi:hypothetical protein